MAGFKTHVTTNTALGMAYGTAGYFVLEAPWPTCVLSAGLCAISGMLPDLDSDSGVPARETMAFFSAVTPVLMIPRFVQLGWSPEMMAVAGGLIYLLVRFGVGAIFKRYTVHRGMWHSLPAAISAGLLAFLVCSCEDMTLRVFKSAAVFVGFCSHLVLDELWSYRFHRGRLRIKKSAGTALKLWSGNSWANVSTYAKLFALLAIAVSDPIVMDYLGYNEQQMSRTARHWVNQRVEQGQKLLK